MKKVLLGLVLLPAVLWAQDQIPPGMMQMFEAAEKARACMEKIDQQALEQIAAEGDAVEAEVKALCDRGERAKAQKKALAFSREVMKRKEIKEMRKCGEMMQGMIPEPVPFSDMENDLEKRHVCD